VVNGYVVGKRFLSEATVLKGGDLALLWVSQDPEGAGYAVLVQCFNADGTKKYK